LIITFLFGSQIKRTFLVSTIIPEIDELDIIKSKLKELFGAKPSVWTRFMFFCFAGIAF